MSLKQRLPLGIDDFKKIRENQYYFVDKSLLIKDVIDLGFEVLLLLRPRRFGKTLHLSMLKYFFDHLEKQSNLFLDLSIEKAGTPYLKRKNSSPVIFLSLKNIKGGSWPEALSKFKKMISDIYKVHNHLLMSDQLSDFEKDTYRRILQIEADQTALESSLEDLSQYLYKHFKKKVYIFVDEYDSPIQEAHHSNYANEMLDFMRSFLGEALKGNSALAFSVVTGILKIAKESLFSGINNFKVYSVLDSPFKQYFAWTETEVNKLLINYGLENKFEEVAAWYDGYTVSTQKKLYNPWSVLNFVADRGERLRPYWVNTGNPRLLIQLLAHSTDAVKKELETLLCGNTITQKITENLVMQNLEKSDSALWTLLLYSGYLTALPNSNLGLSSAVLKVPNYEVKLALEDIIQNWFFESVNQSFLKTVLTSLIDDNITQFSRIFTDYSEEVLSYFDIRGDEPERFYHALVLGMLVELRQDYIIRSNRESGYGRYDVIVIPKNKSRTAFILEFKKVSREQTLDSALNEALQQIHEKAYDKELRAMDIKKIVTIAMAFHGKKVKIKEERLA